MLQLLRRGASTWVVRIFLAVLVISFGIGIWQGNTLFSGHPGDELVSVGKSRVTVNDFMTAFDRRIRQLQQQTGGNFTREQAVTFGLPSRTLGELVSDATFREAARRLDLTAPDDLVADAISRVPAFRDPAGRFDADQFRAVLQRAGLTEKAFTEDVRKQLAQAQLLDPIGQGARLPRLELETLYRYREEKRSFQWFAIPAAAAGNIAAPDEEVLKTYLAAHADRFSTPALRAATVLSLSPADLAKGIEITDDAARAAYDERHDSFTTPEKRDLLLMVLPTREQAQAAAAKVKGGADFVAVAKDMASLNEGDVKRGLVTKDSLPAELGDAVFRLPPGTASDPIQAPFGWQVAEVAKIEPGSTKGFDEVKADLKAALALEQAADKLPEVQKKLQDTLAGGATLEEAAAKLNLPVTKIAAIDAQGRDGAGTPVKGLPAAPDFLSKLFDAPVGQDGGIENTTDNGAYVARVDSETPSAVESFESARDGVLKAWTEEQRSAKLDQVAQDAAARVAKGEDFQKVADDLKAAVQIIDDAPRGGSQITAAVLPNDVLVKLFSAPVGETAAALKAQGGAPILVRLSAVTPADPAADKAAFDQATERERNGLANDLAATVETDFKRRIGVDFNQEALNQVIASLRGPAQ